MRSILIVSLVFFLVGCGVSKSNSPQTRSAADEAWEAALPKPIPLPPVFTATLIGDIDGLNTLLAEDPEIANVPLPDDTWWKSPKGTSSNLEFFEGQTPLFAAVKVGNIPAIETLLAHGADIHTRSKKGGSLLHAAVYLDGPDVLELLARKGLDVNIPFEKDLSKSGAEFSKYQSRPEPESQIATHYLGWTPLHCAADIPNTTNLKALLELGANVNAASSAGVTPLHVATIQGHTEIARILVDHGARLDARSVSGFTPLYWAAAPGAQFGKSEKLKVECIQFLLSKGADINATDNLGQTPLDFAINWNARENAVALLQAGADTDIKDKSGKSARDLAKEKGMEDILSTTKVVK